MKQNLKAFIRFVGTVGVLMGIGFAVGISVGFTQSTASAEVVYQEKVIEDVRDFPRALQIICQAESGGKQLKADGHVVRGHVVPSDIGICQINEPIWNDKARDMKLDIFTEEGNKSMALWLFDHYGTEPWNASKSVWLKKLSQ